MNTKNILIAERYSNALVGLAQDGKLTYAKISTDLTEIKNILSQSQDLAQCLTNPIVSVENKIEIIDKVFTTEIDILIVNFLKVLVEKNRMGTFPEILNAYNRSLDNINNIQRISVVSAVSLTEDAKNRLKQKLEEKMKKNVILDLEINSDIVAGLVIKIGDNVIDMSLKHKLEDLSKSITR